MTKSVEGDARDALPVADALEHLAQGVAVEVGAGAGGEQGRGFAVGVVAGLQVFPESTRGPGRDGQGPLFFAFAVDGDALVAKVGLIDTEGDELGGAEASVNEEEEDGAVAVLGGAAVVGGALGAASVFLAAGGAGEEELKVGFGEGDDGGFFGFGPGDVVDDVAVDQVLVEGPGPQGREAGVIVEEGFGGEVVEAGEKLLEISGGDGGQGGTAADVALEGAIGGLIIGQGMR